MGEEQERREMRSRRWNINRKMVFGARTGEKNEKVTRCKANEVNA